ncbi:MAG: hypothetical protein Tsb005_15100 [Gammaproteobacteria bacterium]
MLKMKTSVESQKNDENCALIINLIKNEELFSCVKNHTELEIYDLNIRVFREFITKKSAKKIINNKETNQISYIINEYPASITATYDNNTKRWSYHFIQSETDGVENLTNLLIQIKSFFSIQENALSEIKIVFPEIQNSSSKALHNQVTLLNILIDNFLLKQATNLEQLTFDNLYYTTSTFSALAAIAFLPRLNVINLSIATLEKNDLLHPAEAFLCFLLANPLLQHVSIRFDSLHVNHYEYFLYYLGHYLKGIEKSLKNEVVRRVAIHKFNLNNVSTISDSVLLPTVVIDLPGFLSKTFFVNVMQKNPVTYQKIHYFLEAYRYFQEQKSQPLNPVFTNLLSYTNKNPLVNIKPSQQEQKFADSVLQKIRMNALVLSTLDTISDSGITHAKTSHVETDSNHLNTNNVEVSLAELREQIDISLTIGDSNDGSTLPVVHEPLAKKHKPNNKQAIYVNLKYLQPEEDEQAHYALWPLIGNDVNKKDSLEDNELRFQQLVDVIKHINLSNNNNSEFATSIAPSIYIDEADEQVSYQLRLLSLRALSANDILTFICLGRGMQGYVPIKTQSQELITLVISAQQLADESDKYYALVKQGFAVLIIDQLWDIPTDQLGLITARRLAIFCFALKNKLTSFMMLDDNLTAIRWSSSEMGLLNDSQIRTWHDMVTVLNQVNAYIVTITTPLHYRLTSTKPTTPHLNQTNPTTTNQLARIGYKIFLVHWEQLHNELILNLVNKYQISMKHVIQSMFPPVNYWGEDLTLQAWIAVVTKEFGPRPAYLQQEGVSYVRAHYPSAPKESQSINNLAATTVVDAESWLTAPISAPASSISYITEKLAQFMQKIVINTLKYRKDLVKRLRNFDITKRLQEGKNLPLKLLKPAISPLPKLEFSAHSKFSESESSSKQIAYELACGIDYVLKNWELLQQQHHHDSWNKDTIPNLNNGQLKALQALHKHWQSIAQNPEAPDETLNGHIVLPTGCGKTFVIWALIAIALQSNHPLLMNSQQKIVVVVNTLALLTQFIQALEGFNQLFPLPIKLADVVTIGTSKEGNIPYLIFKNHRDSEAKKVEVFCAKSFTSNNVNNSNNAQTPQPIMIVDEFDQQYSLFRWLQNEKIQPAILLGLSATNDKLVKVNSKWPALTNRYASLLQIYKYPFQEAYKHHIIPPCIIDYFNIRETITDLFLINSIINLLQNHYHPNGKLLKDCSLFILVPDKQCPSFVAALNQANLRAASFSNVDPNENASHNLAAFKASEINILVGYKMLACGVSAPGVAAAINVRRTTGKDPTADKQFLGRLTRHFEGELKGTKIGYYLTVNQQFRAELIETWEETPPIADIFHEQAKTAKTYGVIEVLEHTTPLNIATKTSELENVQLTDAQPDEKMSISNLIDLQNNTRSTEKSAISYLMNPQASTPSTSDLDITQLIDAQNSEQPDKATQWVYSGTFFKASSTGSDLTKLLNNEQEPKQDYPFPEFQ